jgi:hypothetical protein
MVNRTGLLSVILLPHVEKQQDREKGENISLFDCSVLGLLSQDVVCWRGAQAIFYISGPIRDNFTKVGNKTDLVRGNISNNDFRTLSVKR